jgi:small ligand-binding sensory domain FIST
MRIASAVSVLDNTRMLADDLASQLRDGLSNPNRAQKPHVDLLILFVSAPLQIVFGDIAKILREQLRPRALIGCTAEGVLGSGAQVIGEFERVPAAAAIAMELPGVHLDTFHLADEEWTELLGEEGTLANRLEAGQDVRAFIMLADPFSVPIVQFLDVCSKNFPTSPIVGGMASGVNAPGETRLAMDEHVYSSGLVGVSLAGNVQIDCVISQGCKPVGETHVVTKSTRNLVLELGGRPALQVVEEMINHLPEDERQLVRRHGLQIGRVIDEGKGNYGRGDFLIRPLVGITRENGGIAIGDLIRPGQTIQFHVRDEGTADEDLRLLLQGQSLLASDPAGALLFSCNGRGTRLFSMPDHDVSTAREFLGPVPMAGFFAAGEFGPVGRRNFIHGQTASFALFRPAEI